ncbi:MAG: fibronectin type III domain-containing protein, partial [Clostridia bacterium]|nr:fibronectin type III domain-containing protein [Clostridia bacterium]
DTVNVTLEIRNGADAVIRDVSVQYAVPELCAAADGAKTAQSVKEIAAGETATLKTAFVVRGAQTGALPQTGDSSHMLLWLLLGGMSVFALLKMGKDARKQLTAIVLCAAMLGGLLPAGEIANARAQEISLGRELTVSETIEIMGQEAELIAVVGYTAVTGAEARTLSAPKGVDISCTSSAEGVVHWGAVSGATGYEIYQSRTKTGTYTKSAEKEGGTTKSIAFLTSSGVNYVKVRAYKTVNGTRQYSAYSAPRLVFPVGIVDGVSATFNSASGNVVLKWNTTANAQKYKIFASDTENGTYSDVVTVLAKTGATQSASLSSSLKNKYIKIRTVRDDNGTRSHSAYSTPVKASAVSLAAPTGVDVSCTSLREGVVHWNAVSGATGYEILQSRTKTGTYTKTAEKTGGTTKSITFLTSSGVNYVKVRAYKTVNGIRQHGAESAPRLVFPVGIVNGVSATISSTSGNVVLTWNTTANAHKYKIFASDTENGTYTDVVTVLAKTTATQSASLSSSLKNKYLKIRTVRDDNGTRSHSAYSTPVKPTQTPTLAPTPNPSLRPTPPATPTGVSAAAQSSSSIRVSWSEAPLATGYYVYRATSSGGTYSKVGTVDSGSTTSFTDTGLTANKTYYYKVKAYNFDGESGLSSYASAKTNAEGRPSVPTGVSAAAQSSSAIKISWSKVSGATGYYVYRSSSLNGTYSKVGTVSSGSTTSYTNTGLSSGTAYYYKVSAYNSAGEGTKSGAVSATTQYVVPSKPAGVKAAAQSSSAIKISWNQVTGAEGYYIYRSASASGTYIRIATTYSGSTTSYTNTNLSADTKYYYKVSAYNDAGESAKSGYVYATTQEESCSLSVSAASWSPSYTASGKSVTVTHCGSYSISTEIDDESLYTGSYAGTARWLTASRSGNTISLSALANYSAGSRSGSVYVTCSCGEEKEIVITQKGGGYSAPTLKLRVDSEYFGEGSEYGPLTIGDHLWLTAEHANTRRLYIRVYDPDTGASIVNTTFDDAVSGSSTAFYPTIKSGVASGKYTIEATASNSDLRNDPYAQKKKIAFKLIVTAPGQRNPDMFDKMQDRADSWVDYTWIPQYDVPVHNPNYYDAYGNKKTGAAEYYYKAGNTYHGLPYTLSSSKYRPDTWNKKAQIKYVKAEYQVYKNGKWVTEYKHTPAIGADCSCLVNDVLWAADETSISHNGQTYITSNNAAKFKTIDWDEVAAGDVLATKSGYGSHIMYVYGRSGDTLTIVEQCGGNGATACGNRTTRAAGGYYVCGTCVNCKGVSKSGTLKRTMTIGGTESNKYQPYRYKPLYGE